MPLDPATASLLAQLIPTLVRGIVALLGMGQLSDEDVAKIEGAIARRKKVKDFWDSLDPDEPT